jgi:hypothetical protein
MFSSVQGLLMTAIFVGFLVVKVWALADCATRPKDAFVAAGRRTRTFWLLITGLAALSVFVARPLGIFGLAGLVGALVYLVDVRPRLRDVTSYRR